MNGKFAQTQKELAIRMALLGVESTDHLQKPKFGKVFLEVEEPIARQYGTEKQFESAAKHVSKK